MASPISNSLNDTDAERDLKVALERYCSCYCDDGGVVITPCAGHQKLADDPVWLRRLRFERYRGLQIMRGEFVVAA